MADDVTRCLPPGSSIEDRLHRGLQTGAITSGDADEVRRFIAYLNDLALHPDEPVADVYARHYPYDELERLRTRVAELEAALDRVRDILAVNRSVSAEPDSLFQGDEQAALAWRMAWRVARDLFARDLDVALDEPPARGTTHDQ